MNHCSNDKNYHNDNAASGTIDEEEVPLFIHHHNRISLLRAESSQLMYYHSIAAAFMEDDEENDKDEDDSTGDDYEAEEYVCRHSHNVISSTATATATATPGGRCTIGDDYYCLPDDDDDDNDNNSNTEDDDNNDDDVNHGGNVLGEGDAECDSLGLHSAIVTAARGGSRPPKPHERFAGTWFRQIWNQVCQELYQAYYPNLLMMSPKEMQHDLEQQLEEMVEDLLLLMDNTTASGSGSGGGSSGSCNDNYDDDGPEQQHLRGDEEQQHFVVMQHAIDNMTTTMPSLLPGDIWQGAVCLASDPVAMARLYQVPLSPETRHAIQRMITTTTATTSDAYGATPQMLADDSVVPPNQLQPQWTMTQTHFDDYHHHEHHEKEPLLRIPIINNIDICSKNNAYRKLLQDLLQVTTTGYGTATTTTTSHSRLNQGVSWWITRTILVAALIGLSFQVPLYKFQQQQYSNDGDIIESTNISVHPMLQVAWKCTASALCLLPFATILQQRGCCRCCCCCANRVGSESFNSHELSCWAQGILLGLTGLAFAAWSFFLTLALQYTSIGNVVLLGNAQHLIFWVICVAATTTTTAPCQGLTSTHALGALLALAGIVFVVLDAAIRCTQPENHDDNDDENSANVLLNLFLGNIYAVLSGICGAVFLIAAKSIRPTFESNNIAFLLGILTWAALICSIMAALALKNELSFGIDPTRGLFGWMHSSRLPLELIMVASYLFAGVMGYLESMRHFTISTISFVYLLEPLVAELLFALLCWGKEDTSFPTFMAWLGNILYLVGTLVIMFHASPSSLSWTENIYKREGIPPFATLDPTFSLSATSSKAE